MNRISRPSRVSQISFVAAVVLVCSAAIAAVGQQASNVSFTSVGETTLTINWTNGSGSTRIVTIQDAAGSFTPSNNTTYSANLDFGAGTDLDGGAGIVKCVFNGNSGPITVTNLAANSVYTVRVYNYTGAAGAEVYDVTTASDNPNSRTTLQTVPSAQPTGLVFSNLLNDGTGYTLSWTASAGGADGYIVVRRQGASPDAPGPQDGTAHSVGDDLDPGADTEIVAYIGAATTFNQTGLSPGVDYFYDIHAYNGSGAAINYRTGSPPLEGNRPTLVLEPATQASNINFTTITENSLTITWTGTGGNKIVIVDDAVITFVPSEATNYVANSNYTGGTDLGNGQKCVFNGSGNSVTVTNLASNTVYHVRVFEYNGSGATQNYNTTTATNNPNSRTTLAAEPSPAASGIIFSAISASAMDVNFTNGGGASRIVLAKQGSAVDSNPVDGTSYTANNAFGSGTQIGTGNYVVHIGSGPFTLTALNGDATYHFAVYEFNGTSGAENYRLTGAPTNNRQTAPTLQATNITFSSITTTTMTVNWTNAVDGSGGGNRRLVLAKAGSAVDADPVQLTSYTANAAFGSGTQIGTGNFVVFDGTSNTVNLTGLTANTVYHFRVYEYNGAGSSTAVYNTTTATNNPNSRTTLAAEPNTQSTAIVFSGTTQTQVTLTWANGTGSNRIVLASQDDDAATSFTNPTDGVSYTANAAFGSGHLFPSGGGSDEDDYVVYNGSGNSVTVTNLTAGTNYHFKVFDYNGTLLSSNYITADGASNNPRAVFTIAGTANTLAAGSGIEPGTFSSLINTQGTAVLNFDFRVFDDGPAADDTPPRDNSSTRIAGLTINRKDLISGDVDDWTQAILGAELSGPASTGATSIVASSITANQIIFTGIPNSAPSSQDQLGRIFDDQNKTYTLRIWLRTSLLGTLPDDIDGKALVFRITEADFILAGGSGFAGGQLVESGDGNNRVQVTATKINIDQQPSASAFAASPLAQQPIFEARDANNNRDLDFAQALTVVTGNPTNLGGASAPAAFISGLANFTGSGFNFTQIGTSTMEVTTASITAANSENSVSITVSGNNESTVSEAAFVYPANIDYRNFQAASATIGSPPPTGMIKVGEFVLQDGGIDGTDPDGLSTTLTNITFNVTNPGNLRLLALRNGASVVATAAGGPTAVFSGLNIVAPDNNSQTFEVFASFNATVTDNVHFELGVSSVTALTSGSTFAFSDGAAGTGGARTSTNVNDNRVAVTASEIRFVQQPTNTLIGIAVAPAVTIEATDNLGSRDLDYGNTGSLSSTGVLSTSPTVTITNGLGTYSPIIFSTKATSRAITTSVAGLTNATSTSFNLTASNAADIVRDGTFTEPSNIMYADYQNTNITGGAGDIAVARFTIRDGGASGTDTDGAPTLMNNITFSISNPSAIRRVALYDDGGVELGEVAGAATVTFSNINGTLGYGPADNSTRTFTLRVSFNNTPATVTDNVQFQFAVTNATTTLLSSDFFNASAGGAQSDITANRNRIEVVATQFDYTTQPGATQNYDANVAPSPVLSANDINGVRDVDYALTPTLTNTSAISMANIGLTNTAGVITFNASFRFTSASGGANGATTELVVSDGSISRNSNIITLNYSALSDIVLNTGFSNPLNIDYYNIQFTNLTSANGIDLEQFQVRDGGAGLNDPDGTETRLSAITFDITNYQNLRQLAIYDGATEIREVNVPTVVVPQSATVGRVTFNAFVSPFVVTDNTLKNLTLRASFLGNGVIDNQVISFSVVSLGTNAVSSSQLANPAPTGITSALTGNENRIEVTATVLDFTTVPASTSINLNFGPVVVEARDGFQNRDLDFTSAVTAFGNTRGLTFINGPFTPAPILSFNSPTPGVLTLPGNFQFTSAPDPPTPPTALTISAGGLNGTSNGIGIVSSTASVLTYETADFQNRIPYISFNSNPITNAAAGFPLATFRLQDGNGLTNDDDGAATSISTLEFEVTTTNNLGVTVAGSTDIQQLAIFNAVGTKLSEITLTGGTAAFTLSSPIVAPDNGFTTFTLRATFKTSAPDVRDLDNIRIRLTRITQPAGSEFDPGTGRVTGGTWTKATGSVAAGTQTPSDRNIINAVATQLDFITQPAASQPYDAPLTVSPIVHANDANAVRDLEYALTPNLTNSSGITMVNFGLTNTQGIITFAAGLRLTSTGGGSNGATTQLEVSDGTLSRNSNTITLTYSNTSDIVLNTGFANPSNILYTDFQFTDITATNGLAIEEFRVRDGGGSNDPDETNTRLNAITFDITNYQNLRQLALYDGTQEIQEVNVPAVASPQSSTVGRVTFNAFLAPFIVADNSSRNLTLRASFRAGEVTDNHVVSFTVVSVATAAVSSSQLATSTPVGIASVLTGDENRIEAVATQFNFTTQPGAVQLYDANVTPSPVLRANDVNGVLDLDYALTPTLTNSAGISMASITLTNTAGIISFDPAFRFTSVSGAANGATAQLIVAAGPISVASNTITINYSNTSDIVLDAAFSNPANVDYRVIQFTDITATNGIDLEQFTVRDGGVVSPDADGTPTELTTITFDITNYQNLRQLALYDGTTEIKEVNVPTAAVAQSATVGRVTFNAFTSPLIVNDNGTKNLTLRASFRGNGAVDNQVISFAVVSLVAKSVTSSQLANGAPTGITSVLTSDENRIEVTATSLDFTSIPATTSINVNFAPVVVEARDSFQNRDLDFTSPLTAFSNSRALDVINGPFSPAPILGFNTPTPGVLTFPSNFQFTSAPDPLGPTQINISAGSLSGTSPDISVISSTESLLLYVPVSASAGERIPYINFQSNPIASSAGSFALATYRIQDGNGTVNDLDGAATAISEIEFAIETSNPLLGGTTAGASAIQRLAVFNEAGTNLGEVTLTGATAAFTLSSPIIAADNNSTTFTLRATFKNTSPDVRDVDNIRVRITEIRQPAGSEFDPSAGKVTGGTWTKASGAVASGAQTPTDRNIINVVADRLDFTTQPQLYKGVLEPFGFESGDPIPVVTARDQFLITDLEFNNSASISASATVVPTSIAFSRGVLTLGSLQYTGTGNGRLTVTTTGPSLSSANAPSIGCSNVEVLNVFSTTLAAGQGGLELSTNIGGGSVNKTIFGVSFNVPYKAAGNPSLNGFTIAFGNPEGSGGVVANPTADVTAILKNIRIFETNGPNFSSGAVNITTLGGTITPTGGNKLVVSFTTPRPLNSALATSYFLQVDVDPSANGSTPKLQPYLLDEGYTQPVTNNAISTNLGSSYSADRDGNLAAISAGPTYAFAALFPPVMVRTYPANGQLNVSKDQSNVMLAFNVPVWSLDRRVVLRSQKTGQEVATLNLATSPRGQYPGALGSTVTANLTDSLYFNIPTGTLREDSLYYVTVEPGALGAPTAVNVVPENRGIMDQAGNRFPGFSYSGVFFFKVANSNPTRLRTRSTNLVASGIVDASVASANLVATFDNRGKAFYLVLDPTTSPPPPTVEQLRNPTTYTNAAKVAFGSFTISQTDPIPQVATIRPNLLPSGEFNPSVTYQVYLYAEAFEELGGSATANPIPAPVLVPLKNTGFFVPGASTDEFFNTATTGVSFSFQPTTVPAGVTYNSNPGSGLSLRICSNSFQTLNEPIWIREGSTRDQFRSLGAPGDVLSFNILLPVGFQFDVSLDASNKPLYGKVILSGADFAGNAPNPDDPGTYLGAIQYLNNTIAEISFKNSGATSIDQITITGLRINGTGSVSGNIRRLGGNAIPAIGNNVVIASISASPLSSANALFTNSYAVSTFGSTSTVTNIPDNFNSPSFQVTLIPRPVAGDFGFSTFSGPGVNVDQLALKAVALNIPFNITMQRTNSNGCVATSTLQHTVYDSRRAIGGLDTKYCFENSLFALGGPFPPSPSVVDTIKFNNLPAFYMRDLKTSIPRSVLAGDQLIFGPEWAAFVPTLPVRSRSYNPGDNPVPGRTYFDFFFDTKRLLDQRFTIGGTANQNPYEYFREVSVDGQNQVYYKGGSLGIIQFEAIYQSIANAADEEFTLFQNVEIFLPPVPIVEVDRANQPVAGTLKYCEKGGLIRISGYPKPAAGVSTGTFTLWDGSTQLSVGNAFVDNGNGTATLNPDAFTNGYRPIRIEYVFKEAASPCSGRGTITVQVTPNPIAEFSTSTLCEDIAVQFTDLSRFANVPPAGLTINQWSWNFSDPNSGTANTSESQNPTHTYAQPGLYSNVSLQVTSNDRCSAVTPASQNIRIGATPQVDFGFIGLDNSKPIIFTDNSRISTAPAEPGQDGFEQLTWTLGNGSPANVILFNPHRGVEQLANNEDDFSFTYPNPGVFTARLEVKSKKGCIAQLSKEIVILPRYVATSNNNYGTEGRFETDNGNWQVFGTPFRPSSTAPSWAHGVPVNKFPNPLLGTRAWMTKLSGSYNANERSALYSANFDTRALTRPMVSFNSFRALKLNDGVVLQYSTDTFNVADPLKKWKVLGKQGEGIEWYNATAIAAKPGDQSVGDIGWSLEDTEWRDSRFVLADPETNRIVRSENVVFRFALAANESDESSGFAVDNFRLGERTRTILLESFANAGSGTASNERVVNEFINNFKSSEVGMELVKMNYRVGFPGVDPFNQDNPGDASSRALYYNIRTTPRSRIDGFLGEPDATRPLFTDWGVTEYNKRTLMLAQTSLTATATTTNGKLNVSVAVNPVEKLNNKTVLYVVVMEQSITLDALGAKRSLVNTGEQNFQFVVKKMLPTVLGTKTSTHPNAVGGELLPNTSYTFNLEWIPDLNLFYWEPNDMAVAVFLQDEDTREVYQSLVIQNIPDPPVNVITGIEQLSEETVATFPNPADNLLYVEIPLEATITLTVDLIDQMGKRAQTVQIAPGARRAALSVSDLAAGVYILRVGSNGNWVRKKVVISH